MEWTDEAIVLGNRRHGEAHAILELMTHDHGRHLGLVRGGTSARLRPALQPGNVVRATWRARLDDHLGHYTIEVLTVHAASSPAKSHVLYGVTHLAALCRLLPERDPHPVVYEALRDALDRLQDAAAGAAAIVRFELRLLAELGFGLDLASCAATGQTTDLRYISPKTGRAVSGQAGEPWRERLFPLPEFLAADVQPTHGDIANGFALTGFFLRRHVLDPRGLHFAEARGRFIAAVTGQHAVRRGAAEHP
ncbi:MAG TPA: DNA repair protein RecO [Xanthobacteraceae bacterium]|nr:DNA repair protein RecO [Xanthobacteraceae bacterium]